MTRSLRDALGYSEVMSEMAPEQTVDGKCVFCEIVAGRLPSDVVAEDNTTLAFMNIDPGSEGHLLVIPKAHSVDLLSVPQEDLIATTLVAQRIATVMHSQMGAEGVNLLNSCGAVGWQSVFHFHLHVIPRYSDKSRDRLTLPYEPGAPSDPVARENYARRLAGAL